MLEATLPGLQRRTLTPLLFLEETAFRRPLGPVPCRGLPLCGSLVPALELTKFFSGPINLLLSQLRSLLALKCLALCAFFKRPGVWVGGPCPLQCSTGSGPTLDPLPSCCKQGAVSFSVQSLSCPTLCHPCGLQHARLPCPSPTPELAQNHVHRVSDAIQPSHPLSSLSPPTFSFSQHQGLSSESVLCIRWPNFWRFSIRTSDENSGLISFRLDRLDLLAVQGTLKSLLQHHSSKASIIQCSAFFIVQLSHPYMTTGKTIALTFVGK